jgi:hypothetical protein
LDKVEKCTTNEVPWSRVSGGTFIYRLDIWIFGCLDILAIFSYCLDIGRLINQEKALTGLMSGALAMEKASFPIIT